MKILHNSGAVVSIPILLASLNGCATDEYAGIALSDGAMNPALSELARRAQGGSQRAQFELGLMYELGDGVELDQGRARQLYLAAGASRGGSTLIHVPRGARKSPSANPLYSGSEKSGIPEAKVRLQKIDRQGILSARKMEVTGTFTKIEDDSPDICPIIRRELGDVFHLEKDSLCVSEAYREAATKRIFYTVQYTDEFGENTEASAIDPDGIYEPKYSFRFYDLGREQGRYLYISFERRGMPRIDIIIRRLEIED